MELGLEGRVALVTAASRGLGLNCARVLAHEGVRVGMAARSADVLRSVSEDLGADGAEVLPIDLDLSDLESITACVETVIDQFGQIDILVANAPGPPSGPVEDMTVEQWREALELNVISMVHLLRQVLPHMRARDHGRIFFITTIGVRTAQPNMVLSNASRLAVVGLAKTLATELTDTDILVNVLAPGPIATDRMGELITQTMERDDVSLEEAERSWVDEVPLGRMGKAEDLATIVALLSSDRSSYTTGAVIPVDGGKSRAY